LATEIELSYAKALQQETDRISYQRKVLLLQIKKIRKRENELLSQAKNSSIRKSLTCKENELEMLLCNMEKQVIACFAYFAATT